MACGRLLIAVFVMLSLLVIVGAQAQSGPTKTPSCDDVASATLPAGNLKLTVTVDSYTVWQPRGGAVKFTIKGSGFSPENMALITCFKWKDDTAAAWVKSPSVRLLDNATAGTAIFSATVPPDLPAARSGWLSRLSGYAESGASTGLAIVPLADFRVMATSTASQAAAWSPLDVTQPVGITSLPFAWLAAIVLIIVAWGVLYAFGRGRAVPGGLNPLLTIISTRNGYASLSQLQIILWSFVIGAGAVYVMTLSGNLIEIGSGTLVLLGISGVAAIGSKLQTTIAASPAAAPAPAAPGRVVGLASNGPAGETEVRLSWAAPTDGGRPGTYTVEYRPSTATPGPWLVATNTLTRPGFRVVGLTPATPYDFQVYGVNSTGPGMPATIQGVSTTPAAPSDGLGPVANFRPTDVVTNTEIGLIWDPLAGASSYTVQYRVHDSDDGWTNATATASGVRIAKLRANTLYDLRIAGSKPSTTGPVRGPWTTIAAATTGPRVPLWSDLVIASDDVREIDVTRVQMLFFTVIVALFVAMRILTSGEIPTIPEGYLLLMGISNGVYLTAKFIPS